MDRREIQSQSQSVPPGMMMMNSYNHNNQNNNSSILMNPNSSPNMIPNPRFPFNPMISPKKFEPFSNSPYEGQESGMRDYGLNTTEQQVQETKRKRGRPKKYSPDGGSIALGLSSSSPMSQEDGIETPVKRGRGRPAGLGKKQLDALGPGGVGFTPHVVMIQPGEDIALKILAFSQEGPRTLCILSANGAVCNVTLRQPESGRTVTYEGRFEIISLSGSFFPSESDGNTSKKGGLCVSLAASDSRVLGGEVAGMLVAATQVQVIMGSFVAEGKKKNPNLSSTSNPFSVPPLQILKFGEPVLAASPPSHGGGSSDSSHENGSSPLDQAGGGFGGPYNNNANQPINHGMPSYPSMNWGNNSGMNIHPN